MTHLKTRGPIGATARLCAHAKDHSDTAPRKIFDTEGLISNDVLAYCARHQLHVTWLLTGKSAALS